MPKVSVNNLVPGMKLAKPVTNESGMVLLGSGTELTGQQIERLTRMNVEYVQVESTAKPEKSREELLSELDTRFRKTENEPYMGLLKRLFAEQIEKSGAA